MKQWMLKAGQKCDEVFLRNEVEMTLGGEPTFVPVEPVGAEWSYAAVGPTKLLYARALAFRLLEDHLPGGVDFFSPGKSYPGEVNPRWAIRLLANRDGTPIFPLRSAGAVSADALASLRKHIAKGLGVKPRWKCIPDPQEESAQVWALLVDAEDDAWESFEWPAGARLRLTSAPGPAGLRLPLHVLAEKIPRRALTLEWRANQLAIFLPPVVQSPFVKLLAVLGESLRHSGIGSVEMQGYVPTDEALLWTQVGLTADPGVLEVNLPACASWEHYNTWVHAVTDGAEAVGLRSWKIFSPKGHPEGSGGGNHLLWGGPTIERNPFFSRPGWMASLLRYWQHHPSLAYLFTGCYVGASSQAPRADESARDRYDLELALAFLESLPKGDHRHLIGETLRHLQTDVTGNSHRSEISLDKFWNAGWPSGMLGLLEFRAIESLPTPEWMGAVALLWSGLAAWLLEHPFRHRLHEFSHDLHDRFFLPTILWRDLQHVLKDLRGGGFDLDEKLFHQIWSWKFPEVLAFREGDARFTIRKAHESWPLLCETPVDGGTTSRFVDTSMERLELLANRAFAESFDLRAANRPLTLKRIDKDTFLCGLRFRRTNLHPSLHPGLPPQMPMEISVHSAETTHRFVLRENDAAFHPLRTKRDIKPPGESCKTSTGRGDFTYDLRIP